MKFTIKVTVPEPEDVTYDLAVERDPGLRMARERLADAQRELIHGEQRHADAARSIETIRRDVGQGTATPDALTDAYDRERTAGLVLPGYRRRILEAEQQVTVALTEARTSIAKKAAQRRDRLQQAALEIIPALEALRAAEAALDSVCAAAGQGEVEALEWPPTLADEANARNSVMAAMLGQHAAAR